MRVSSVLYSRIESSLLSEMIDKAFRLDSAQVKSLSSHSDAQLYLENRRRAHKLFDKTQLNFESVTNQLSFEWFGKYLKAFYIKHTGLF